MSAARRRSPIPLLLFLLLLHSASPSPIKTVVVLVMENRSFDHMLGWMKRLNPEIDGVTGREWNPANASDPAAGRVYFRDGAAYVDPDPGHSFQEIRQQVFGSDDDAADNPPRMDGFAQQARSIGGGAMSDAVMRGFNPADVAVYRELVSQFAVCDRWFASVPSSTQPNRLFVHSGTSGGATSNNPTYVLALHPTFSSSVHWHRHRHLIYSNFLPCLMIFRAAAGIVILLLPLATTAPPLELLID